ncbi:Scr1 family TA system antitoxin-like transcriptional regulator [Streptomyces rugosispiralis]|uniref:Scr1 family TA system antitoxin-like transcriptional regulator n=1 Tax=Streptomyces rugosispiralis TaxID=2967341 RepID=A0ABT1V817_9ACTN|nr:Scr1 family TA system antitoxin-like transcriptional regulator [Streptomyces rugosispiralis]MCQ8193402.1 Scr1 family TA system antitoxin-like transcriptional regulator [Streptomyces rugosispiralis]
MASRTTITARQRRLGTELRRMREHAGLTIQEAADRLGTNRSHVTNMELARFGVSEERVRTLAANYACPDEAYVEALVAMATERKRGWWEEYRGTLGAAGLDLAELEYFATSLRVVELMHIPGLLQTEDYARSVLSTAVPGWSPTELRRRLSHRMKRRDILDRDQPPSCTFIMHETALRVRFGDQRVLCAQLDSLLESSERPNVSVRVVPIAAGGFHLAGISVTYATGPVPQLDTVQLDVAQDAAFLDGASQLLNYRAVMDRTEELALSEKESRDFIRETVQQM